MLGFQTQSSQNMFGSIILHEWAKLDKESFPNFGNWKTSLDWMTSEENKIKSNITKIEKMKNEKIAEFDNKIVELNKELVIKSSEVDKFERRLITSQSKELVEAVIKAFEEIGFIVKDIDDSLEKGKQKREDIQLSITKDNIWVALVEVRGYSKSSGRTSDLQRIRRFSTLYNEEIGEYPQKLIYVVNGQLDISPNYRESPLKSAKDDVSVFAEDNGLVIWAVDLYKAIYVNRLDKVKLNESIIKDVGYWEPK